jgi:hypothetical protein
MISEIYLILTYLFIVMNNSSATPRSARFNRPANREIVFANKQKKQADIKKRTNYVYVRLFLLLFQLLVFEKRRDHVRNQHHICDQRSKESAVELVSCN